jgi:hypothetical protein
MPTRQIRVKPVKSIFRFDSEDEKEMQVKVARMCVLYEDLRVEYEGAQAEQLADLDKTSKLTRRFYFVRRTLGSLTEIEGAINKLQLNKTFRERKKAFAADKLKMWDEAVCFFSADNHQFLLKDWRNDIGGHFHDAAAAFAIDEIDIETVGSCELYIRGHRADVRMKFAYELVAVAMTMNRKQKTER